jgi:hypothetical protein
MPYDVYFTALAEDWVMRLGDDDYDSIMARIELLEEHGPGLGRPVVDTIHGKAIVLVGGDKRDDWTGWYERNNPLADDMLDAHLDSLREDSP